MDSIIVSMISNVMLTKDQVGEAVYMAADCNHDGAIDELDEELLQQAGLLLANVDQSKRKEELQTDSNYVEYLNLIDQNLTVDEPTDKPAITPMPNYMQNTVEKVITFFVAIWRLLISFMLF